MELKTFLKENNLARKIFGKRELVIIQKQISGIKLTQSEKNRLSRDIRPKFKFIEDVSKFKEEFGLKKGAENKRMIERALDCIINDKLHSRIKKVWLFGSMAENKMTHRSDIDIAVLFNKINKKEAIEFRIRVLGEVSDKMDVQVFNILPEKIKKEILKKGKTLYKNEKG